MSETCIDGFILTTKLSESAVMMASADFKVPSLAMTQVEAAMEQDPFEEHGMDSDCLMELESPQTFTSRCPNLDVDFKVLNARKHSTSTPFTSRPASCMNITNFHPGRPIWMMAPHQASSHVCNSLHRNAALKHKLSSSDPELRSRHHSSDVMQIDVTSSLGLEELRGNLFSDIDCDKKSVDSAIMDDSQVDSCYEGSDFMISPDTLGSQASLKLECDLSEDADSAFGDGTISDLSQSQPFSDTQSLISNSPSMDSLSQVHPMHDITNSHFSPSPRSASPIQLPKPPSPNCLPVRSAPQSSVTSVSGIEIQEVLQSSLSCDVSHLIGRKMGLEHVDILAELQKQEVYWLRSLLQYLEPADLSSMCCVSKKWRGIVHQDSRAFKRKSMFLEKFSPQRFEKENSWLISNLKPSRQLTQSKGPLAPMQNAQISCDSTAQGLLTGGKKWQKFWKEASVLRSDESLMKCVRCRHPARTDAVQERARCTNPACKHDFCSKCLSAFHGAKPCHSQRTKSKVDVSVGSKKSKHRLRRL